MFKLINNMRVGARLGAAFSLVILLLVIVSGIAITKISSINTSIEQIISDRYVKVRLAFDVRDGVNDQIKYLRGIVIDTKNPEQNKKRYLQLDDTVKKTNLAMDKIAAIQSTVTGKQKIKTLQEAGETFETAKEQLIALARAGDMDGATEFVLRKLTTSQNAYLDLATAFANSQDQQLQAEGKTAIADGATAIQLTLIFSALAILMAAALGYFLTRSLMYWFWDLYCSPADRIDPRASPLRGKVSGLPPAFVVTCEFDPLRDEGIAYAEAMAAAGVPVEQLRARGHFHSSFAMVDVVITGVPGRVQMAQALRRFAGLPQEISRDDEHSQGHPSPGHRIAAAAS